MKQRHLLAANAAMAFAVAAVGLCSIASADPAFVPHEPAISGLAVQVNEGEALPTAVLLATILPKGQSVRDVLSWQKVEKAKAEYAMPEANWRLYQVVAAVGGKNVVTLFGGNSLYGLEHFGFPRTPDQIEGFANFVVWAVSNDGGHASDNRAANIPDLYAVTIWNEMNGSWGGGMRDPVERQEAMAALLNAVVPKIRTANPRVHIAAGAFVGFPGLAHWFQGIGTQFDWRRVDWLDIHPYLADLKATPAEEWSRQMTLLRSGDMRQGSRAILNPAYYSEWGGPAAARYTKAHSNDASAPNYFEWFENVVVKADPIPVAGGNYFTLFSSSRFPQQGLLIGPDATPDQLTKLGRSFKAYYLSSTK